MSRVFVLAFSSLIIMFCNSPAAVAADAWGCSYEKCLQVCGKVGGKNCSAYCNGRLADKRRDKVCS